MDRLKAIGDGKRSSPVHLYIYPSDLCNHNCGFCAYRMEDYTQAEMFPEDGEKNPNRMIPLWKVVEILTDARNMGVEAVQFSGGGEPTMHPDMATILRTAHALGLKTGLVTNGVRLDRDIRMALLGSEWVRVSVDAGKEATYRKIRGLGPNRSDMDTALTNLSRLVEEKNASPGSGLFVGVGFVITKDNWKEIPLAVELAEMVGVDNLRFTAAFTNQGVGYYDGLEGDVGALLGTAMDGRPWVTNTFWERLNDLTQGRPEYGRCVNQQLTAVIGADLNLYACCVICYTRRGLVGSLKNERLAHVWDSRPTWEYFERFDARKCERCQFNERNRQANGIIGSLPEIHGEFV